MATVKTQLVIDGKNNSKRVFSEVNKDLGGLTSDAKKAGAALLGVFSVGAISQWVSQSARAVAEMNKFARLSNTNSQVFQRWAFGAKTLGIEQDKLGDIFKDVQDKVGDFLQTGGGALKDFFENVAPAAGVTAEQFRNLSGPDALQLYVKTLEGANLSQSEMTFYLEAIANDASLLAPLLANNGEKLEQLGDQAERLGRVLDQKTTKSIEQFQRSLENLDEAADNFRNQSTGVIAKIDRITGASNTAAASVDRLSGFLNTASAAKEPGWLDKFSNVFRLLSSPKLFDAAAGLLIFGPDEQKKEADQYAAREGLFDLHVKEMNLIRQREVAETAAAQKKVLSATESTLKRQTELEKKATSDLAKAKQAQIDTQKRYSEALASLNAGVGGGASYGAAQSLKVGAREALRAGDIEGAKQQAQAALKMLQDLQAAGENTYGFEGFIKELQDIEETADSQALDGLQEAFEKAQSGAAYLKAELEKLKKNPVSLEMDQASFDAVKAQIDKLGGGVVVPVKFDAGSLDYSQPYTLQDPGPAPQGFATGGYINGPGSGTSDSIPALLSNGEYVIRAAAVRKLGKNALDLLNRGIPIPRFADGGLVGAVSSMQPAGPQSLGTLDISLGGETFQVFTNAPQADQLRIAAKKFGRTHK